MHFLKTLIRKVRINKGNEEKVRIKATRTYYTPEIYPDPSYNKV